MIDEIPELEPLAPFRRWLDEAWKGEPNAHAMTLATTAAGGQPSARVVLLKGFDERGFVFYTNFESRKSAELFANPYAALCFLWKSLNRQVRIEGPVDRVADDEADAYFASRPRDSQIGAWASDQSRPMEGRMAFEQRIAKFAMKFGLGRPPRPPQWSGYRIIPAEFEFWRDKPFRLHDRLKFVRSGDGWSKTRLYP